MNIEQLTAKIVQAVKNRDKYPVDSEKYEEEDQKVNSLIGEIKPEDVKEFNRLYNQPSNWQ